LKRWLQKKSFYAVYQSLLGNTRDKMGQTWGAISSGKLSLKLCVNSSFYCGINWTKFDTGKQINAETRIKSIVTTEAVATTDTVH
jgi:hypothetical protein